MLAWFKRRRRRKLIAQPIPDLWRRWLEVNVAMVSRLSPAERGRIAVGQVADIVLWSGDPLEVTTVAEDVIIAGRAIDMRSRQTELRERYLPRLRNRAAR